MKKFLLSFFVIGSFALYVAYYGSSGSLSYISSPVTEVKNNTITDTQNTTASQPTQIFKVPRNIFGEDDDNEEDDDDGRSVPGTTPTPILSSVPVTTTKPTINMGSQMMPVHMGLYKDGTYVGSNEYAYSDYIKVTAVISGGKITDIQFPTNSIGPNRTQQIYSYSMPILKSEAISAQSASINGVSGATYTSAAFKQSLAYALTQAK
ncbi:MAG: FMN-binding protein [Minisyncoccia bacterium]